MSATGRTYDAIIVGAGPTGCVLASRLSEDPTKTILLLEAGADAPPGEEHFDIRDPFPIASSNPAFQWSGLKAEIGADRGDGSPRTVRPYIQAFGVGGASNINGMGADRGQPGDYDRLAELGIDGWDWKDVLPYFLKLEKDLDFGGADGEEPLHGQSGPMPVRRLPRSQWDPFCQAIGHALERRQFRFLTDYMTDHRQGFASAPTNSLVSGRVSASMAYLTKAVRARPNLTILPKSMAHRIAFRGARATGIQISRDGKTTSIEGREIILTCGAIQTPTLLMRSGIGSQTSLKLSGIKVVKDLRGVGANLQNHPCVSFAAYLAPDARQASTNPWFLQNWLRYSSNHPDCDENDMHIMAFNKTGWHGLGRRVGSITLTVLQAFSRGRVELDSNAPDALPKISFNTLSDPRDLERLVAAARFTLELLNDPAVAACRREVFLPNPKIVASLSARKPSNAVKAAVIGTILDWPHARALLMSRQILDVDHLLSHTSALREYVLNNARLQYHVCGTSRMGAASDPDAVVDSVGRVHGLEGLRVADASILPTVPRGYPHFILIMMAEKLADMIKTEWARQRSAPSQTSAAV